MYRVFYCGCLTILMETEMRKIGRKHKGWKHVHTFGFEEGRSATELLKSGEERVGHACLLH